MKDPIVDQLFGFLSAEANIRSALMWLEQSKIMVGDQNLYDLQKSHKMSILRLLFKSKYFGLDQKMALLESTLGDDKSDLAENCRASCMAGLPDAEVKAQIWAEITNPSSKDSVYVKSAKM